MQTTRTAFENVFVSDITYNWSQTSVCGRDLCSAVKLHELNVDLNSKLMLINRMQTRWRFSLMYCWINKKSSLNNTDEWTNDYYNRMSMNRDGDKPLKTLRRCYLFSIQTCINCYDLHKDSWPPTHLPVKDHSFTKQMSLFYLSNVVRPRKKCHSSVC